MKNTACKLLLSLALITTVIAPPATAQLSDYLPDYMIGEPASRLPGYVGEPLRKHQNAIRQEEIFFYPDYKILIRKDIIVGVKSTKPAAALNKSIENIDYAYEPTDKLKAGVFNDIMGELAESSLEQPAANGKKNPFAKKNRVNKAFMQKGF